MRIVAFIISALTTVGLIVVLDTPLPVGGTKTPRLGYFLSPQHGFWQNAEAADHSYNASFQFENLEGKVEVYFDERLVPHVFAENEKDAYFVQGYLHAKFRLWQMEFQTHAAAGRLSEIMGAKSGTTDFLKIDRFFRRLGMVYGAENSLKELEANEVTKNETDAYTAGVNAYISSLRPNQFPVEYKLLNYQPEKWTNLKTQLFLKYMCYDLAGHDNDFEMTAAKSIFSAADIELLDPLTQDSLDPIIPPGTKFPPASIPLIKPAHADSFYFNPDNTPTPPDIPQPDENNGSNNWAVAGSKTRGGSPILCNDPHLGLNLPSLWYEMQISTPSFNAYGASFPGAPSIIIGFNDSIAWGVTNAGRDVKDYYEITFKDSTMKEYLFNGKWLLTSFRNEVIKVKGGQDVKEQIPMTVFGPVMYDKHYPDILNDGKYYALRWKAHDASNELLTFNKINRSHNYTEFTQAISTFQTPGQNFVFASKSDTIAIKQQGMFPAKWKRQGDFVMPGIDSAYAWQGYIPASENPEIINPARGFVSSANQLATDTTYPYFLGGQSIIYRGLTINRKLDKLNDITVDDMMELQTDNYNVFAEMARPVLLKYLDNSKLSAEELAYLKRFTEWNLRNDINETAPVIFDIFWDTLAVNIYADEFARTNLPVIFPANSTLLEALIKDSNYKYADDVSTSQIESVHYIIEKSWKQAVALNKVLDKSKQLFWHRYKNTGVKHLLKLPSLSRLSLPIGGGKNIINATTEKHGPSWRMIVQLKDKPEAYVVYPGGQSGNPGSRFYDNFVDYWVEGKYYPAVFLNGDEVEKDKRIIWKMIFSKP